MFFSVVSETLVPGNVSNKKENIMYKKFEMELADEYIYRVYKYDFADFYFEKQ